MATNARIKITAEDRTKRAIKSAQGNLKDLKDVAGKATAAIAGLASGAAFGALIQKQSEFIRVNTRMASQLGITTESLTRLQYAITQNTEVTGEQFNEMLQEFNVRMGDAEKGTGPLIEAFQQLGLNFKEIKNLNTEQAFLLVSDALANMGDKARAAFLAEELFAGEAAKAIPIMLQGADAIKQYGDEAERLGQTFSQEEADKVLAMQKEFNKLAAAVDGLGRDIAIFLSSEGSNIINWSTELINNLRNLKSNVINLFKFQNTNRQIDYLNAKISELQGNLREGFITSIGESAPVTTEMEQDFRQKIKNMTDEIERLRAVRDDVFKPDKPLVTITSGARQETPTPTGMSLDAWENDGFDQMVIDRQQFMIDQATYGAERFNEIWGATFDTFEQGVGDAFATAIVEQESLGDALQMTMRMVAKSVISTLVQMGVQQITNSIKVKAMQSSANAALIGELGLIAAAATPAAIATNIATAGGAGVAAAASSTAAATAMKSAMLLGQFHDGIDYVPKTGSYLLEKGERVIPAKDNKPAMMGGSVNITIQAIDTQSATQVIMQNEPQIIDMIQRSYDSRGQAGGPVR